MHILMRYRRAKGLTQEALASKLGVAIPTVQRWEHGRKPRPRQLLRLAETLGVDTAQLDRELDGAATERDTIQ